MKKIFIFISLFSFLFSQKSSLFYDNTMLFSKNPFFLKRDNLLSLYFEHFSYQHRDTLWKTPFYYTEYLLSISFYKKFLFAEINFSKEGDFINEMMVVKLKLDSSGFIIIEEDTIKFIATTLTGKTGFIFPYKMFKFFYNMKFFYYSHPFLDTYKKYSSIDSFVYNFKKYAFSLDLGTGINFNKNIYLFFLIENFLKTQIDYGISTILTGPQSIFFSNLPFTARSGCSYILHDLELLFIISHFLINKFGGSEVFIEKYIKLKPELSLIVNYKKGKNHFNFSFSNKFYPESPGVPQKSFIKTKNIFELYISYLREIKRFKTGLGAKFDTRFIELEKTGKEIQRITKISPFNIFLSIDVF